VLITPETKKKKIEEASHGRWETLSSTQLLQGGPRKKTKKKKWDRQPSNPRNQNHEGVQVEWRELSPSKGLKQRKLLQDRSWTLADGRKKGDRKETGMVFGGIERKQGATCSYGGEKKNEEI